VSEKHPYWSYVLVFDELFGSHDQVRDFLDSRREIVDWQSFLPYAFFFVSRLTAEGLTRLIIEHYWKSGRFLILDTNTDKSGLLPGPAWDLMYRPEPEAKVEP
jgi:hypothetical protein